MLGCDAAIDDADDDALAEQPVSGPQAAVGILQPEKGRAVVGLQILVRVLPDSLDFGALREPRDLRCRQTRGEAVDGVTVAVEFGTRRADAAEQAVVRLLELLGIRVGSRDAGTARDVGSVWWPTDPWACACSLPPPGPEA